jgi:nucleotide-binding universal stress UspA family protein
VHALGRPGAGTAVTSGPAGPAPRPDDDRADHDRTDHHRADGILREATLLASKIAPELPVSAQLRHGGPGQVLPDESRQAALLALGNRGLGGFSELLVGSVAVQTVNHGACPVLVVRGDRHRAGPVVVGVDGSAVSMRALDLAVEEAVLRGAELVALHVWTGSSGTELNDTLPMSYAAWSGDQEEERVLAEALAGIGQRHPDLPVRREVVRGSARHLLVDRSRSAGLVVVGDHGYGSLTRLLAGSVSQYVIHRAACPVLVVRPGAGAGS